MAVAALLGATGQLIMKYAGGLIGESGLTPLSGGLCLLVFCLYGGVMMLFMQGLKHGRELSTTYPVYSLTFPFAAILSGIFFGEVLHYAEWGGLALICAGVGVMNIPERSPAGSAEVSS